MLPLLNLTTTDLPSPEALRGAASLVPGGSGDLRGRFATILQSTVPTATGLPSVDGEALPLTGKPLPPATPAETLELDVNIVIPAADSDLPGTGVATAAVPGDDGAGLPVLAVAVGTVPDGGRDVLVDERPAVIAVPAAPMETGPADPAASIAAAGSAGNAVQDATRAVSIPQAMDVADRGSRAQDRDRAIDPAIARLRGISSLNEQALRSAQPLPIRELEIPVAGRPDGSIETQDGGPPQRRVSDAMTRLRHQPPADTPLLADSALRRSGEDGSHVQRAQTPAAWQQGTVLPDLNAEPGPRLQAEVATALPRATPVAPAPTAPTLPPAAQSIDIPVQQSGWDFALADRVTLMANGKLGNAEIRLTPAELGPLKIRLDIDDGVANVSFQSQHPLTRDALEQALPRLRELLAENGLTLGQADVGDDGNQQKSREAMTDARAVRGSGRDDAGFEDPDVGRPVRRIADGLVDTFA